MKTNKQRITVVHIDLSSGGVQVFIRNIIENINHEEFKSIIISPYKKDLLFFDKGNNKIDQYEASASREINPVSDLYVFFKVFTYVKRLKPDILHCHSAKGGFIGRLVGRILNIPTVYTPHAFSYLSTTNSIKRSIYIILEKIAVKCTSHFVACSNSEFLRGINEIGFTEINSTIWGNPIKFPCFVNDSTEKGFICAIGRPSYQKNLGMLIETLFRLKEQNVQLNCMIVGLGHYSPEKKCLLKQIKELNLEEQFSLLDWIPHEKIFPIIKNSLFLVSTSRYEGLPLSLVEAMALGKPVVATDVDGNRDCVIDGKTGFLVPLDNIDFMAEKIKYLFQNDEVRNVMSKNALSRFKEHFDITKMIGKMENVYKVTSTKKWGALLC